MLCLHHCNSRTQEIPFYLPGQLRLFCEYYWTLKMYIYIFSVYSMMSELYLCVQVFFFFMSMGVLTLTHPRLLPTLTFTCCWGFTSRTSPPKICTQEASTLPQAAPHHCVLWVSHRQTYVNADSPTHALTLTSQRKKKRHMCNMPKEWNGYADDTCVHKHSFLLTLRSKVTKKRSSLHCLVQKQD